MTRRASYCMLATRRIIPTQWILTPPLEHLWLLTALFLKILFPVCQIFTPFRNCQDTRHRVPCANGRDDLFTSREPELKQSSSSQAAQVWFTVPEENNTTTHMTNLKWTSLYSSNKQIRIQKQTKLAAEELMEARSWLILFDVVPYFCVLMRSLFV